jgi:hypothetical protein
VRKLQAARVPHRLAVYVGGLAALRDWRVAMDHHVKSIFLVAFYIAAIAACRSSLELCLCT